MPENHLFGKVMFSGRPHARMLRMDLVEAAAVPGVKEAKVTVVWDPPWDASKMSEEAKKKLGMGQ